MKKLFLLTLTFLGYTALYAQIVPKRLEAKRTNKPVIIDGRLNDPAWQDASLLDDYTEFRPVVGRKEDFDNRTETYLMYDDAGIYFGGTCYERSLDSISKELVGRDGFGANDYIGIIFDTYNDKLNGFEYFITPLGEQWDAKMTSNTNDDNGGEDFSWNAVWKSAVIIHDKGWSFEIFLPYSAIRFSKDKVQDWGINITRRRRKTEQQNTWSAI
ncbi:MAG TPA: carbohydrate binding family 9 domain-containing protein, partial [Emticicia sp.]